MLSLKICCLLVILTSVCAHPLEKPGMVVPVLTPPDSGATSDSDNNDVENPGANSDLEADGYDDKDYLIPRPVPEDINEDEGRSNVEDGVLKEQGSEKDDEDDTVTIDAASCDDLLKDCKQKNDLLCCQAYNENCSENEGDDAELGNYIDWTRSVAKGNEVGDGPQLFLA